MSLGRRDNKHLRLEDSEQGGAASANLSSENVTTQDRDDTIDHVIHPQVALEGEKDEPEAGASKSSLENAAVTAKDRCRFAMTAETFQELIKRRKDERKSEAEKARLDGLKKIADRKSKTGVNPLAHFPREIWDMILGELNDPIDLGNMYQMHDVFRGLLESNRIRDILLPQVIDYNLPVVKKVRHRYYSDLDLRQLKALRLVSKSLRDSVDKWIEARILQLMRTPYESDNALNSVMVVINHFTTAELLNRILEFSRGPVASRPERFFLRSLRLVLLPNLVWWNGVEYELVPRLLELFGLLRNNITEFLESVGDQILHFNLFFEVENSRARIEGVLSTAHVYDELRAWLQLMPNLKWLSMTINGDLVWLDPSAEEPIAQHQPMPTLNELERVDVYTNAFDDVPIFDAIFSANPHVKYLSRNRGSYRPSHVDPVVGSLALETVPIHQFDLPLLQQISNFNWMLKRLIVKMNKISIAPVFRCLENMQTLQDLTMEINHVSIGNDIGFLQLPNLKTLEIKFGPLGQFLKYTEGSHCFFSLQFLLHCSKLESLSWVNWTYDSRIIQGKMERLAVDQGEGMIDFQGGFGDLSLSNVWDVFPRLKSIQVKFRQGKREGQREYFTRKYRNGKFMSESKGKWWYR